jgi:hypothetical protein
MPLTYTVTVSDPAECGTPPGSTPNCAGSFNFTLMPVRPTVIASSPNGVIQGLLNNNTEITLDGGYFGRVDSLPRFFFRVTKFRVR